LPRAAVQTCGSTVHIAPYPEQPARRGRKREAAIAKGICFDQHSYCARRRVEHTNTVPVVATKVFGPGEIAVVGAGLMPRGAIIGMTPCTLTFIKQRLHRPIGCHAREDTMRVAGRLHCLVAPAL